jgi:membrane protein
MNKKDLFNLFKTSSRDWLEDNAPLRAAALTFFIILPLPSLLIILVTILAQFYGQTQAIQQLIQQITSVAGPTVAQLFNELLTSATSPFSSVWASFTLVVFSLAGAIGAFSVLRDTMNIIWEVKPPKLHSFAARIRRTIGPFLLVSGLGLIVIIWTGITTSLFSAIRLYSINGTLALLSIAVAQVLLSFSLAVLLFALTFKVIPEVRVHWTDVVLPSVVTGIAFTVVNYVLGIYLQTFTVTSIIGAAGALIIILLWVFILNLIILFGAELSKVYASTGGPHPKEYWSLKAEKIIKPLQEVEELIEKAVGGDVVESSDDGDEVKQ